MRMAEEFERCHKCQGGWFRIERRVLVLKDSSKNNPRHLKEIDDYVCTSCGESQYVVKKDAE